MDKAMQTRLEKALITFIERASKEDARPAEIAALAGVAEVLSSMAEEY